MRATRLFAFSLILFLLTTVSMTAIAVSSPGGGANGANRDLSYWTFSRVRNAQTRDFVYNPTSHQFDRSSRKQSTGEITGIPWTNGGQVELITGKVFFTMGATDYVCSASVVEELLVDRSLVLTAAHCVYDETNLRFARHWIFVPAYTQAPAAFDPDGEFCASTQFGCWTASALVVSNGYAFAGGFNDTAALHDYAFAVLGNGGTQLDTVDDAVGSAPIAFSEYAADSDSWLFGYPAARQFKGSQLVYCRGALGFDSYSENSTYRVPCKMTGGSSGGPWMSPFVADGSSAGNGTIFSLNSYGYRGISAMYGPKLNADTEALYVVAATATENTIVS